MCRSGSKSSHIMTSPALSLSLSLSWPLLHSVSRSHWAFFSALLLGELRGQRLVLRYDLLYDLRKSKMGEFFAHAHMQHEHECAPRIRIPSLLTPTLSTPLEQQRRLSCGHNHVPPTITRHRNACETTARARPHCHTTQHHVRLLSFNPPYSLRALESQSRRFSNRDFRIH
jgi:hypothetical protein